MPVMSSVRWTIGHGIRDIGGRRVYVVLSGQDPAAREIMLGIAGIAASRGWFLLWGMTSHSTDRDMRALDVHAAIVLPGVSRLPPSGLTVVAAGTDLTARGIPSVVTDDFQIGQTAGKYLLDKGIRSLATFGEARWPWVQARAAGLRQAARDAGGDVHVNDWLRDNDDPALLAPTWCHPESFHSWLQQLPRPAGILAACDHWADVLCLTIRAAGLRVPDDVAVIGVDNDVVACEFCNPPLTSVSLPHRRVGAEAALLVERGMQRPARGAELIRLPGGAIVERRSTDMLAIPDPDVVAALAYIRNHATNLIRVADVLRHVPTYQHRLERGFRKYLGRTMLNEIRRVHVEHAKRLLVMTDLPIPEVAVRSGFRNTTKLGIAFRQLMGITPSSYRKQHTTLS